MRSRGRRTILASLRSFANFERFSCGIGDTKTVEIRFTALDYEIGRLRTIGLSDGAVRDAADRLALIVHDLKSRAYTPDDYVRYRTEIYRKTWVDPLIAELEQKEKRPAKGAK